MQRAVQEHNVKEPTQLLMDRDQEYSRQEQARKRERERSKDATGKRRDVDERLESLSYLKDTEYERSIVETPPGSMPGSSGDGSPPPPKVKTGCDREVDRIEDLLGEVHRIRDQHVKDALETGEPVLDFTDYYYRALRL